MCTTTKRNTSHYLITVRICQAPCRPRGNIDLLESIPCLLSHDDLFCSHLTILEFLLEMRGTQWTFLEPLLEQPEERLTQSVVFVDLQRSTSGPVARASVVLRHVK